MTHSIMTRITATLSAVGISVTVATASLAQQQPPAVPPSDNGSTLDQIVVTAQKRVESAQSVPIAITTISGAQMSDANISVQTELPILTPDLQVSFNSDFVAPYIRGIGTEYANAGLDPSVALYVDDQYYPRANGGLFSMSDLDHVEVLKGPQGTLYGRNTVGGAIRLITNEASPDFDASMDYTFGNFGRIGGAAMVNGPIAPTLSGRIAFDIDTDTGYVRNNYNSSYPELGNRHQYDILAKLLWEPTDRFSVHLHFALFDKKDFEGSAFIPVTNSAPTQIGIALGGIPSSCFYCSPSDFYSSSLEKGHDSSNGTTIRLDYKFDPLTFSSITGFQEVAGVNFADLDTTSLNIETASSPINNTALYTQEFQFVSTLQGPWKYTAGVYMLHSREEYWFDVGGAAVFPTGPANQYLSGDGISVTNSIAAYGETTFNFTDKWDATLGGRFTNETKDLPSNYLIVYQGNDGGVNPQTILSQTMVDGDKSILYRRFTPKAVVEYHPEDKMLVYASFSRGFKSGGFNLPSFGPVNVVKPESISAFEIGEKIDLTHLRINTAVFLDKQNDLQVEITDQQTGGAEVVNAAKTKIYGVENEIDWVPNEQWNLGLGSAWLHGRYEDFTGSAYRPCNAALAAPTAAQSAQFAASCAAQGGLGLTMVSGYNFGGNPLTLAPDFSGNIRGTYTVPFSVFNGVIHAQVIENYQSSYSYNPEQTLIEKGRALLTANLGWKSNDNHWKVSFYGTNLTNKEYNVFETYQNTGGWRIPAVPREYGVTFGAKWR